MTVQPWQMTDLQRAAAAKRTELEQADAVLRKLQADLEIARAAEDAYTARCRQIRQRLDAIRFGPHPTRVVGQGVSARLASGPTDEEKAEYWRLERDLSAVEHERKRWLEDHAVRWVDGMVLKSRTLAAASVGYELDRARVRRNQLADQLSALEESLTPGQLLGLGDPAPAYVEHTRGVAAARERAGVAP